MSTLLTSADISRQSPRHSAPRIERFRFAHGQGGSSSPAQLVAPHGFRQLHQQDDPLPAQEDPSAPDLEQVRSEAYQRGWQEAREQFDAELQRERETVGRALDEFAQDRFRYFRRVEKEVVELALSIAKRILHREAQMDPLILQGAVRAVLERLSDASGATMRLHPARLAVWEEWFTAHGGRQRPSLVADPSLQTDQCVLETAMGTTEIGMNSQLQEIENGFCDLLATRNSDGS